MTSRFLQFVWEFILGFAGDRVSSCSGEVLFGCRTAVLSTCEWEPARRSCPLENECQLYVLIPIDCRNLNSGAHRFRKGCARFARCYARQHWEKIFRKRRLEYSWVAFTLISVPLLKFIFGLFLGLVIQFSQVQPCMGADSGQSCPTVAARVHACCEGKASCPCANNSQQTPTPVPAIPLSVDLKLNAPKARELDFLTLFFLPDFSDAMPGIVRFPESTIGFSGVPLAVAFCSFVI